MNKISLEASKQKLTYIPKFAVLYIWRLLQEGMKADMRI